MQQDWLVKVRKNCFILPFFLIMHAGGRTVCLSVGLAVNQTFCQSVGWLVGMCACIHTYDYACIYAYRQTDRQQTDRLHACTYVQTKRKKERNRCNFLNTYIHTYIHFFCFTSCLSVRPFVCLSACVLSFCLPPSLRRCLSAYLPFCLSIGR